MSRNITADPAEPIKSATPQVESNRHFDSVEAQFFEQGLDSVLLVADGDYFDDQEAPGWRKWFALSRSFLKGLAVGGLLGAVLVGVIAWRVPGHARAVTFNPVPVEKLAESPAPIALVSSAPTIALLPGEQAGRMGGDAMPDSSGEKMVAMAPPPDADTWDLGRAAEPAAFVAKVISADDAQQACSKAIAEKQRNRILTTCEAALAANPRAAEFAVALAKTELDRGKTVQAFEWSKKAIAADPDVADPYVFIGEAEQTAGHKKAARDAYLHYLRLAPSGRYAADLRAVLSSL